MHGFLLQARSLRGGKDFSLQLRLLTALMNGLTDGDFANWRADAPCESAVRTYTGADSGLTEDLNI